jgi:hypothetical protein
MDNEIIIHAADIARIGSEIAERLRNYLLDGNPDLGLIGLKYGPQLVRREGTTQALFVWNDAIESFEIDLTSLNTLKVSAPPPYVSEVPSGFTALPKLVQWREVDGIEQWNSAYDSDLTAHPEAPYLEIDNTLTAGKISYQRRGDNPMPYDPSDYPALVIKPGTDDPAPEEGAEGDWSEDEWLVLDSTDPGSLTDVTLWTLPTVVFFDDDPPGIPNVRIARMIPVTGLESWGEVDISEWNIVISIHANEFMGTVTKGFDADSADLLLGGAVWQLVGNYEGMKSIGLTNSEVRVGSPVELKLETTFPITIKCEVYSVKPAVATSSSSSSSA